MLFPGSRIWFEGAAGDLVALTDELKGASFSGHIVLEFQESIDVVVCVNGEFLKVVEKVGRRLVATKKYREIWGKCQIKAGRMIIFELPAALATLLRGMRGRRLLCSGTAATGCDPARLLAERRAEGFSGLVDCVSPEGKLLLHLEGGAVRACYYTEYVGLALEGLAAFRAWHEGYQRATHPSFFFLSELGDPASGQLWDEILMDYADQMPSPLRSSLERLQHAFGRVAAAGETLFRAEQQGAKALYLLEGRAALHRQAGSTSARCGTLAAGSLVGLEWALGHGTPRVTAVAEEPCRFIAFGAAELPLVLRNSPGLAARCVREAAATLLGRRARLAAYRREPRLRDVERAVDEALLRRGPQAAAGVPAMELLGELMQILPLSLPEIDALFRTLAAVGGVRIDADRVSPAPCEV